MKIIKSQNYKKMKNKFSRGPTTNETTGIINDGNRNMEVNVVFTYSPSTPDVYYLRNGDPGYPGSSSEWEFVEVTDDAGRRLSDEEIDIYEDQLNKIIEDWEANTDLSLGPDPDFDFESNREERMIDELEGY